MYEAFYHFTGEPFQITPDNPDNHVFFQHRSYDEAKTSIGYAFHRAEGIIVIAGKPGTGKTTLINDLLSEQATTRLVLARLEGTQLGAEDLLQKVSSSFGVDTAVGSRAMILLRMKQVLIEHVRAGRRALLIIDEAQALSSKALQEIYKLTNLQIDAQALFQVFLVGQEQLWDVVCRPDMEQFHQRIITACHLEPLSVGESGTYVKHRLRAVGWKGDPSINSDALSLIHKFSCGVPGQLNILCDRLLFDGLIIKRHKLDVSDVRHAIKELHEQGLTLSEEGVGSESGSVQAESSKGTVFENLNPRSVKSGLKESSKPKREALRNSQLSVRPIDKSVETTESPVRGSLASTRVFDKSRRPARVYSNAKGVWFMVLIGLAGGVGAGLAAFFMVDPKLQKLLERPHSSSPTLSSTKEQQAAIEGPRPDRPNQGSPSEHKPRLLIQESQVPKKASASDGAQVDQRVIDLLARAERQVAAKHLSTPPKDNALETYRKVLRLVPGHEEARQGIARIKAQYTTWANAAMLRANWIRAQAYLEKALAIDPGDGILTQQLARARAEIKSAEEGVERIAQKETRQTAKVHSQVPRQPTAGLTSAVTRIAHVKHEVITTQNPPLVSIRAGITGPLNRAEVFLATHGGFSPHIMYDDGTHGDRIAGDSEYGTQIPLEATQRATRYYVAAYTGEGTVIHNPARAELETYIIKLAVNRLKSPVVINEFMASNDLTIADSQGRYKDWIELYNATPDAVALSGYYLSDDPAKPKKWRFPDGISIAGYSYLFIWADRAPSYTNLSSSPPELHTNFELSRRGGQILLTDTDENGNAIVDTVTFGRQREDVSMGRIPNGVGKFGNVYTATPGWTN